MRRFFIGTSAPTPHPVHRLGGPRRSAPCLPFPRPRSGPRPARRIGAPPMPRHGSSSWLVSCRRHGRPWQHCRRSCSRSASAVCQRHVPPRLSTCILLPMPHANISQSQNFAFLIDGFFLLLNQKFKSRSDIIFHLLCYYLCDFLSPHRFNSGFVFTMWAASDFLMVDLSWLCHSEGCMVLVSSGGRLRGPRGRGGPAAGCAEPSGAAAPGPHFWAMGQPHAEPRTCLRVVAAVDHRLDWVGASA